MILYKRKKIRFIVSIAVLLFLPLFGNAATTEESEEEILFITSYPYFTIKNREKSIDKISGQGEARGVRGNILDIA